MVFTFISGSKCYAAVVVVVCGGDGGGGGGGVDSRYNDGVEMVKVMKD